MECKKRKNLLERAAETLALPEDVLAGASCVRIVGCSEVYVENHRGILSYGENEILLNGGKVMIRVAGAGLRLRSMTAEDLLITGLITTVELE